MKKYPVSRIASCVWLALTLASPPSPAAAETPTRLRGFSARANVGAEADALVVGVIVAPGDNRTLLLRGVGPTLADFGVTGFLADPTLTLYRGTTIQDANDNWPERTEADGILRGAVAAGIFPLRTASADAALLGTMANGAYALAVSPRGGATGIALAEFFDLTPAGGAPRLINASARARVGPGSGALIAGFVLDGPAPRQVLLRGVGPALAAYGVAGALADPQLALFRGTGTVPIAQNDNWAGAAPLRAAFATVGAFPLGDTGRDAALLATLDPGVYTVQLTGAGGATGIGLLELFDMVPATPVAPKIVVAPRPLTVNPGALASLTVIASGSMPLSFAWTRNGAPVAGATADTLVFPSVSADDAGSYAVTVSNAGGSTTAPAVAVAVLPASAQLPPAATFDLVGFATLGAGTTGGGPLSPGDANFRVLDAAVTNKAQQLRTWLESTTAMVVDIQTDVDLGALNNVGNRPKTNPELMASGLGVINVRSNKTIISSTGATLRHGTLNISGQNNIIVRNLRFRGLWEFDEGSQNPPDNAPWGYKIQDWDYIDIQNGARNVWVDHCDFEKSYDGIADTKASADLLTYSWCRLGGDTEGAVARQIGYLEKLYQGQLLDARIPATFYRGLREGAYAGQGIPAQSVADILTHELPHDKCNLVGSADTATGDIGYLNMTFHHIYYHGCRQRLPRMRFGNAHVFNLYVDNAVIAEGTNMATASTCDAAVFAENNLYQDVEDPFPAQSGTSPAGRAAQSGCRWLRGGVEQSFAGNTFLQAVRDFRWNTATRNFGWTVAAAPNAAGLPYPYRADAAEYTRDHLAYTGVIVPASAADRATLAGWLVRTTH